MGRVFTGSCLFFALHHESFVKCFTLEFYIYTVDMNFSLIRMSTYTCKTYMYGDMDGLHVGAPTSTCKCMCTCTNHVLTNRCIQLRTIGAPMHFTLLAPILLPYYRTDGTVPGTVLSVCTGIQVICVVMGQHTASSHDTIRQPRRPILTALV